MSTAVNSAGAIGLRDVAEELEIGVDRLARRGYQMAKRSLDLLVTVALLISLCWLFALIAALVELDSSGPVLFRQVRIGRDGESFTMLKFRTMRRERRGHDLGPPPGVYERRRRHKTRGDPRVTYVGRFLRRTCLDELPQLWNVLVGEMSLVGPRLERRRSWPAMRHGSTPGTWSRRA